jgi:two-component system response regulator PrrA
MTDPILPSVLVVDDDEGVALTFSRMLRLHGYHVDTATSPETGLAMVRAHTPDAILLDLRMPLVGGLEFLRRLRAAESSRATSVTIVTGDYFIEDEMASQLKALGAQVCFKPMWVDDLVVVVRGMLGSPPPPATACA